MSTALDILLQHWQHKAFRPMQEDIIQSILAGKDTLALLPTGGGKSICFQVPALMQEGVCLVISPLVALMKDQVSSLENKGISAVALHSGMSYFEVRNALLHATEGAYKFIYLSPERLETKLFRELLPALQVNLLAVDEAHCISQWGYDFRPPYLRIANLRNELRGVPVLALTASATPRVQDDIIEKLQFSSANIFRQSFERKNISYSVFEVDSKINKIKEILQNVAGSGIVYCRNRRQTKEVSQLLAMHGISANYYHAGLTSEERSQRQAAWRNNQLRVMVCTNAFGMGIDKADVRTVVHYDVPDCLENYYQEAGRAGRDGKKAYAVLLYQPTDIHELEGLPDKRFPEMHAIRKVYQAMADYMQVPVGSGEGGYYDFDLVEFIRNFQLDAQLVMSVLKVLEQEGHISFQENIFLPAQVKFTAERDSLQHFENSHSQLEPLIKCLLRSYEGIIDNRVSVNEKNIARLIKLSPERVKEQLLELQAYGIISYLPQKETPQVHFLLNRAPAQFLHINHQAYLQRKEQYALRVETMLKFIDLKKECRSKYIAAYFGDEGIAECGTCDNCLTEKHKHISGATFTSITEKMYALIPEKGIAIKDVLQLLKHIHKDTLWKVIDYLQSEGKLTIDEKTGLLKLVNTAAQ